VPINAALSRHSVIAAALPWAVEGEPRIKVDASGMREVTDEQGLCWDVHVLFGSYGIYYLIFAAKQTDEVRKSPLAADNQIDAERALAALSWDELLSELACSVRLEQDTPFGL